MVAWYRLDYKRPRRDEAEKLLKIARFYADHDIDASIVWMLRHKECDVKTASEIGAEQQPDIFHYRRAFKEKRVLLTHDKGYLNNEDYPLLQTRGVIIFNIDYNDPKQIARALEVI